MLLCSDFLPLHTLVKKKMKREEVLILMNQMSSLPFYRTS
jgi:hypothetical protein